MFYQKKLIAKYLTIFVGGNHEVSQLLCENYNGGFLCDKIYFMGYSNIIDIIKNDKIYTIGGISGIYDKYWYRKPYKSPPIIGKKVKSEHRIREYEVAKLYMFNNYIDIFISHDWPKYIWAQDGLDELLQKKPFFEKDIINDNFANIGTAILLNKLEP